MLVFLLVVVVVAPSAVGQGAPQAINRCMCVCVCVFVCVIVVIWAEWVDVGLWVAVCFLAKISLHRPACKTTFARLTQSQAISQSFRVFITFRSMRDTTFFHFSNLFFIQNYRFLYHGDQKISWWTLQVAGSQLRNPPVKFRQERWLHLAIDQHPACPNGGRLELWPRKWFLLEQNPWRWACWSICSLVHVDRCRWRSNQLTSDLKRCLLFQKCLRWSSRKAVSVPTSVIGGFGATGTSDLVHCYHTGGCSFMRGLKVTIPGVCWSIWNWRCTFCC